MSLYTSLYYVTDTKCAAQLGTGLLFSDNKNDILLKKPGFHLKLPMSKVIHWDTRIQHTILKSIPLMTTEGATIRVEYQLSWCVQDALSYVRWMEKNSDPIIVFQRALYEALQTHWTPHSLLDVINNSFDFLKVDLDKQAEKMGVRIINYKVIRKLPSPQAKKILLTRMQRDQANAMSDTIKDMHTQAAIVKSKAKFQQAIQLAEAQEKASKAQREGEIQAMQLYTETYHKNLEFADLYQKIIRDFNFEDAYLVMVRNKSSTSLSM